ncbi:MAG: hypothetical protein GTN86_02235 [Xanthomonadales bacterium]|nr:hypothetical protein [Xanthomonadales bacterium]NIN58832.1 hypothetical protein [Xanthomonadales bacterium]NIN74100.1 hypothetical protein [Xanthomonadales bacterium]NIO14633.1 hypothetical protein [Xanthomonadales bacterium]NIP11225.1 hypothetical protein [Xanthomonadales bacterium]
MADDPRPSLFVELKRRNVFRVGVAYIAVSWVLLQIGDVIFDFLELPAVAGKFLLAILALLFVPILVFAWAYEMTPEGLRRESDVDRSRSITHVTGRKLDYLTIGLVVFGVAFVVVDRTFLHRHVAAPATVEQAATPGLADDNSIAVLPFADMSPQGDQQYFSDGISEELLNLLSRVDRLRVASRTSSFAYKEQSGLSVTEIAGELKVGHILEGSVRKAGDRVRITAQLIDAGRDKHLWSETYDRELDDIFAIQDEIANSIVEALRGTLGLAAGEGVIEVEKATDNLNAYDLFLKARDLFLNRSRETLPAGIETARRVVELDPNFARAWELLGAFYSVAPSWGVGDSEEYGPLVQEAVDRALALNPGLAFAYAIKGQALFDSGYVEWEEVLSLIGKSLELDPTDATVWLWQGIAERSLGFIDRAATSFERCQELDPAYENCFNHRVMVYFDRGQAEAGLRGFDEHMARSKVRTVHWNRYMVPDLVRIGDRRAALLAAAPVFDNNNEAVNDWIALLEQPGQTDPRHERRLVEWAGAHDRLEDLSIVWMTIGRYDLVAANYETRLAMWRDDLRDFRRSDDFQRVVRDSGIGVYWRSYGFPPQCRPLDGDRVECD